MALWLVVGLYIAGCSTTGRPLVSSEKSTPEESRKTYQIDTTRVFDAAQQVLGQQGFTIERADAANGQVKAIRSLKDTEGHELPNRFTVLVNVTGLSIDQGTKVSLVASRQTAAREESIVTAPEFYRNFFMALDLALSSPSR
jgi:hypothetical protein